MRKLMRVGAALALVGLGYVLGSQGLLESRPVHAQAQAPDNGQGLGKDAKEKLDTAFKALEGAREALANEGRYKLATEGTNVFAISIGGVNAMADLETGRGVDPETFAALYAGLALPDIQKDITRNAEGQLTYKNKVIRMYPIARLKQAFLERNRLAGIEEKKPAEMK